MLELILTVGNYMNSSAKTYEPIHGFDISFLSKVILRELIFDFKIHAFDLAAFYKSK